MPVSSGDTEGHCYCDLDDEQVGIDAVQHNHLFHPSIFSEVSLSH